MSLILIDHFRGGLDERTGLPPFDWGVPYEHVQWWDRARGYSVHEPWFVQIVDQGVEVARVELDDPGGINPEYTSVPELGPERLEIQFFEVAIAARRRGVGAQAIRELGDLHQDRRLFAYSEGANGFWSAIGWERFDHPEGENYHRPLFIQPRQK